MDRRERDKRKRRQQAWQAFMQETSDMVFFKDTNSVYQGGSMAFARLVGLEDASQAIGKTDFDLFKDQALARRYIKDDKRLLQEGVTIGPYIEPIPGVGGRTRYASTRKGLLRDEKGTVVGIYGVSRDITYEYESKQKYRQELQFLFQVSDRVCVVALLDLTARRLIQVLCREEDDPLSGAVGTLEDFLCLLTQSEMERQRVGALLQLDYAQEQLKQDQRVMVREYRRPQPGGGLRWMREEVRFLVEPFTGHMEAVFSLRDVQQEKEEQAALRRAAELDAMTGLLHHEGAMGRMERYLAHEGAGRQHALLIIDLDNFKGVNDTFGHRMGDLVIQDTARAIQKIFRGSDIIGRIGGDEFMVLMKNIEGPACVARRALDLMEALQYTCEADGKLLRLSASVGVSLFESQNLDTLYAQADNALYQAKALGKNHYVIYSDADDKVKTTEGGAALGSATQLWWLLENMDSCVLVCRVEETIRFTYASPNTTRRMGWNPAWRELGTEHPFSAVLPQDQKPLEEAIFRAARRGETLDQTIRVCWEEGHIGWWRLRGVQLAKEGDACQIVMVATDVTDQRRIEERHNLAVAWRRRIEAQEDMLLWEADLCLGTLRQSGAAAQRLGLERRQIEGLPALLTPQTGEPPLAADAMVIWNDMLEGREGKEYLLQAPDRQGLLWHFKGAVEILRDKEGQPIRAVGLFRVLMPPPTPDGG